LVGSPWDKLRDIIEKKTNVPTNVNILFSFPPIPTILFVAAAMSVILEIIKNVAPPFVVITSVIQGISPSSSKDDSGSIAPPCNAKLTELNNPPITKRNRNNFTIDRFIGLRISDGLIIRSEIFMP